MIGSNIPAVHEFADFLHFDWLNETFLVTDRKFAHKNSFKNAAYYQFQHNFHHAQEGLECCKRISLVLINSLLNRSLL